MKAGEVDLDLHEADTPDGTAADCERISKLPEQDAELDNLYKGVLQTRVFPRPKGVLPRRPDEFETAFSSA